MAGCWGQVARAGKNPKNMSDSTPCSYCSPQIFSSIESSLRVCVVPGLQFDRQHLLQHQHRLLPRLLLKRASTVGATWPACPPSWACSWPSASSGTTSPQVITSPHKLLILLSPYHCCQAAVHSAQEACCIRLLEMKPRGPLPCPKHRQGI